MEMLFAIILFVILSGIFILTYVLNKRIPKPDGCDEIDESCMNCSNTLCKHSKKNNENNNQEEEK